MRLAHFLSLVAVLMLACASADVHAYASPLQPENAHRGFSAVDHNRTQEIAELSADGVKENSASAYDCTSRQTLGEQFDPNLGFYNLRARWMDPKSARFVTMDSFGGFRHDPQSLHKYTYVDDDPVNSADPSGHCDCDLPSLSAAQAVQGVGVGQTVSGVQVTVNYAAGKAFERQLLALVERELSGAVIKIGKQIVGKGGKRFYDLLVRFNGKQLIIEAKTALPLGGGAFKRLIGQLLTYSTPEAAELAGADVLVVSNETAEAAALALDSIEAAMAEGTSARFVQGTVEFMQFIRTYFLVVP